MRLAILGLLLQSVAMLVPMPLWPGLGAAVQQAATHESAGGQHAAHHAAADGSVPEQGGGHGKGHPAPHPCQICITLHHAVAGVAPAIVAIAAPWSVAAAPAVPPASAVPARSDVATAPPRGPPSLV